MRNAPAVPELQEDDAALGVDRVGDELPALDLLVRIDARHVRPRGPGRQHRRRFADDQAALRGALAVICSVERIGRIAGRRRAHACQRRHDHAVRETIGPDLQRGEQRVGHA